MKTHLTTYGANPARQRKSSGHEGGYDCWANLGGGYSRQLELLLGHLNCVPPGDHHQA
ncbi:unnamed protein product [Ectocarpus sp. CCAP 1310/34]|nr:unnamed protein product [Ectocarpus sp. CCAP 1310/34]